MRDHCGKPPERRYEPFTVGLPFGRTLIWDGRGLSVTRGRKVPDGTYGLAVVKDGVLVDLEPQPLPVYTPPACVPPPQPCGDGGQGGDLVLDPSAANLSKFNLLGQLLTTLRVVGGDRVTVSGSGTDADPLRVSVSLPASRLALDTSTKDALKLTGQGTEDQPYMLDHAKPAGFTGGPGFGGFSFDAYGHATGYAEPPASGVNQVTATPNTLNVLSSTGVVVLSLASLHSAVFQIDTGRGVLEVDTYGRVTDHTPYDPPLRSWRFVSSLASATQLSAAFETSEIGFVRGSVLGLPLSASTAVVSPPVGYSATIDGSLVNCWAALGRLEMKSMSSLAEGEHTLVLTSPSNVATPVIVDLDLCL